MKVDGGNAVQLLILVTGITIVPALLFTVTGFTRILIVLGFIRNGLGTPTAPPNQVLVGIALFLTIFVMAPTFSAIKKDAIDPLSPPKDHTGRGAKARRGAAPPVHVQADPHQGPGAVREARAHEEPAEDA